MKLSIVIPVYNEEETVKQVIEKVKKVNLPIEKEIIVVDDGSNDKSFEIIKKINGIRIIRHKRNMGKGAAVKSALKYATGDIFIIQDADLELDPEEIPKVIDLIVQGKARVVYGSRNIHIKKESKSLLFYFGGRVITLITNFLYGTNLTDEPCGYKAFKTELLRNIKIKSNRFEWEPEITAKIAKRGIKIYEVPVKGESRSMKQGKKLRRRDGLKALLILLKYRLKD